MPQLGELAAPAESQFSTGPQARDISGSAHIRRLKMKSTSMNSSTKKNWKPMESRATWGSFVFVSGMRETQIVIVRTLFPIFWTVDPLTAVNATPTASPTANRSVVPTKMGVIREGWTGRQRWATSWSNVDTRREKRT